MVSLLSVLIPRIVGTRDHFRESVVVIHLCHPWWVPSIFIDWFRSSGQLDPADADIYLDALWGPLYFKYERVRREGDPVPRWSDYRMVGLFLLLNLALQLGIAFKIYELSQGGSGDLETVLFEAACWRISSRPGLLGVSWWSYL